MPRRAKVDSAVLPPLTPMCLPCPAGVPEAWTLAWELFQQIPTLAATPFSWRPAWLPGYGSTFHPTCKVSSSLITPLWIHYMCFCLFLLECKLRERSRAFIWVEFRVSRTVCLISVCWVNKQIAFFIAFNKYAMPETSIIWMLVVYLWMYLLLAGCLPCFPSGAEDRSFGAISTVRHETRRLK